MSLRRFKKYLKKQFISNCYVDDYMSSLADTFGESMGLISSSENHVAIRVRHKDHKFYRLFFMLEPCLTPYKGYTHMTLLKIYRDEELKSKPKSKYSMTMAVATINDFLWNPTDTNRKTMCNWLTLYMHTSHRICNTDGSIYQPSFPEKSVVDYRHFPDREMYAYAHKTNRLLLIFDDDTEYEISLYKFKRFVKREWWFLSPNFDTVSYEKVQD